MADRPPLPAGQPDELSPLDYLLHRGEAHPATRSAFLDLEILDRPADWGRLREAMDRASRVVIRMRQKVVVPPLPTTPPRWVVDPDFDLDYHLRRVALPGPGTLRQLLDLAEVTLQSPLDTSRALWEAVYVEGLEEPKAAGPRCSSSSATRSPTGWAGSPCSSRSTTPSGKRSHGRCRRCRCRAT